ncbi:FkbM family methyltransferase [Roseomonas sp. CAU 1739]
MLEASEDTEARSLRVPGFARPAWLRPAAKDLAIFQQVFVKREYDMAEAVQYRHIQDTYRDMLRRGERPLIIDCGAHVGFSALWFRRAFPEALIFAVEPNPANAAVFRRNLDGEAGVTLFEGGIWNKPGRLRLTDAAAGMAGRRAVPANDAGQDDVTAITIEEILEQTGSAGALIVKVDIEGGEQALFDGETPWLDRVGMLVIELHDWLYPWQGSSDGFFAQVGRRRFDRLFRGENMFCFRRPRMDGEGAP